MSILNTQRGSLSELADINNEIIPLKALAKRELASIYGLTGKVYTPHIDAYMQECIKKADILASLKKQNLLPLSKVEVISSALDNLHKRAKKHAVFEYEGNNYKRLFLPLKLSKSGKTVRQWAKVWMLQHPNGRNDSSWENEIREIWPTYFLIRTIDI